MRSKIVIGAVGGLLATVGVPAVFAVELVERQSCGSGYTLCTPSGASSLNLPATGPQLAPLYNDLLASIKNVGSSKRMAELLGPAIAARDASSMCCNEGLACLNLQGFNIPMCYDHFTTNFKLADGSTGTIDSGAFSGADGGSANLQNGSYTAKDMSTGNMYSGSAASNSPTNTAAIPTPFTGTGVGSAIPVSALGGYATFIITVPATTVPGTTFAGETAPSTVPGTTEAGTTIAAHTSLITSMIGVASASTSAASSSSTGAANGPQTKGLAVAGIGAAGIAAAVMML